MFGGLQNSFDSLQLYKKYIFTGIFTFVKNQ